MTELLCIFGMCALISAEPSATYVQVHVVQTEVIVPPCVEPRLPLMACEPATERRIMRETYADVQ